MDGEERLRLAFENANRKKKKEKNIIISSFCVSIISSRSPFKILQKMTKVCKPPRLTWSHSL